MNALRKRGRPLAVVLACAVVILAVALIATGGCHRSTPGAKTLYHCPMHPSYVSDKPGDCPICGMRLVPVEDQAAAGSAVKPGVSAPPASGAGGTGGGGQRRVLYYRNPMNPSVTSPVPAKDEMGMDYVPVYADEAAPSTTAAETSGGIAGRAPISLSAEGVRLAGVQTAVATRERIARTVRAVGLVRADEGRVQRVQTRVSGWIRTLAVSFTGQVVRKGDPILTIYSPELLASQEEFLRARASAGQFAGSSLEEVRRGGEDLLTAARRRLELLGVPDSFIAQLERTGQAQQDVALLAPFSGYVTAKSVNVGQQVSPGMELYTVTDLSKVWVEAQLYEYEAPLVRVGQTAGLTSPYDPAYAREAKVSYINPVLDENTRTLTVRLDVANPDLALKPGMFASVRLDLESSEGVVVPDDAVMNTGDRQLVFVQTAPDQFAPRPVRPGLRGDGRVLILSGLAEGERVAVRANFLLDSESRLRAAVAEAAAAAADTAHAHGGGGR